MMTKSLEDMTLEELWQLFPIFLREHQDEWKDWYEEERLRLLSFLPEYQIVRLSHIGSTSVETIWAKPIVDIMLEIPKETDMAVTRDYLQEHPAVAKNYEQLKLSLWKQYEHNRDAYTDSKTDFIKKYTKEAKKLYGRRYEREVL